MKAGLANSIVLAFAVLCAHGCEKPTIRPFHYGGLYHVEEVVRNSDARRFSPSTQPTPALWRDGAISVLFTPTPYGVGMWLENRLPYKIRITDSEFRLINWMNSVRTVQFRDIRALAPAEGEPAHVIDLPGYARMEVGLDVVSPTFYWREPSGISEQVRGSQTVLLSYPAFCSGYYWDYSAPYDLDHIVEEVRKGKYIIQFEVQARDLNLAYEFHLKIARLGTSVEDEYSWITEGLPLR